MGLMIDGEWRPDRAMPSEDTEAEAFERMPTTFRNRLDAEHPPAPDRYHLYIARPCPWAHRTAIVRRLKGLEDIVSMDVLDPIRFEDGWEFSPEKPGCTPDTVNGENYLRALYRRADPQYTGKVSVPVLWDREAETIVNNESADVIEILDRDLDDLATRDVTLFPADLPVAETIEELYAPINDGVYRAGFARSQAAYDAAVTALFDALDDWNDLLAEQRYLCGDRLTAADICLFTTMYRFDEVYHTHFMCNRKRLIDYEHLWGHTREMYQLPGVAETCHMDHCKQHYYRTHTDTNPSGVIAIGPDPDFESPHDRAHLPGEPPQVLLEAN